jgi:hypothetical protein
MKIEITPKQLYLIELINEKWGKRDKVLASQSSIDYYTKWWTGYTLKIIEELGDVDFSGVEVELTGSTSSNCYHSANYKVTSPRKLESRDLDILRAYDTFMGGQEVGKLYREEEINGKFVYNLKSVCDSSD